METIPATRLRQQWRDCRRLAKDTGVVGVSQWGGPVVAAVVAPAVWERGRTRAAAGEYLEVQSKDFRARMGALLDDVVEHDQHTVVLMYGRPDVVLVPWAWAQEALADELAAADTTS